eukprot:tig00000367_g24485.t1
MSGVPMLQCGMDGVECQMTTNRDLGRAVKRFDGEDNAFHIPNCFARVYPDAVGALLPAGQSYVFKMDLPLEVADQNGNRCNAREFHEMQQAFEQFCQTIPDDLVSKLQDCKTEKEDRGFCDDIIAKSKGLTELFAKAAGACGRSDAIPSNRVDADEQSLLELEAAALGDDVFAAHFETGAFVEADEEHDASAVDEAAIDL